jgi:hypothetical protein
MHNQRFLISQRGAHQADIQPIGFNRFYLLLGAQVLQNQRDIRVSGSHETKDRRNLPVDGATDKSNLQFSNLAASSTLGRMYGLIRKGEDLPGFLQKDRSGGGEFHMPFGSQQQQGADLLFQRPDLLA